MLSNQHRSPGTLMRCVTTMKILIYFAALAMLPACVSEDGVSPWEFGEESTTSDATTSDTDSSEPFQYDREHIAGGSYDIITIYAERGDELCVYVGIGWLSYDGPEMPAEYEVETPEEWDFLGVSARDSGCEPREENGPFDPQSLGEFAATSAEGRISMDRGSGSSTTLEIDLSLRFDSSSAGIPNAVQLRNDF